ncbi:MULTISPECIES: SirB1 family protein [Trichocoleus]|uniref:SirB1 family protein n=1 Tax=Trichocoleus desertorum GB2-A4 TaxID=2933944 RepID=A0ABV0JEC4_9CYAN|nr:SirB1 family protein [Trichocoleus sp. FACHB-46]MBD1862745.1 SirB1 family protein [Trichocoleus sp. FACHB-46]
MTDLPWARQCFYRTIAQPDEQINLAEAALYIAQEEYPDLDIEAYFNALDTMASEVEERLPTERYPLRMIQSINQYLYEDLGFTGNTSDYYDPRNSFLNDVIERRTGIPITLSLVYMEIARRVNFPMTGVGMPGHFLIRPSIEEMEVYVDAYHHGETLFAEDCQTRLNQIYGQSVELQPVFLQPIGPRQFLARMLTNLKMIYLNRDQAQKSLAAIERILLLFPDAPLELRDRGIVHYHLGAWPEAHKDLKTYLAKVPDAEDAVAIQQLLDRIAPNL